MHEILEIDSGTGGPRLLVFGAIHGNEICGTEAIRRLYAELKSGERTLKRGHLTMVPVCNPAAYEKGVRYIDKNLNRVMRHHPTPACLEEKYANALVPLFRKCDYFLDLHSMTAGHDPIVFEDFVTPENTAFAEIMGCPRIVVGWASVYRDLNAPDTLACAHQHGKSGILVECGQHDDPVAKDVAYTTILRALVHLQMTTATLPPPAPAEWVRMEKVIFKEDDGAFTQDWTDFTPVRQGTILACRADGTTITAPEDGYILLPNAAARIGDEWFYIGKRLEAAPVAA